MIRRTFNVVALLTVTAICVPLAPAAEPAAATQPGGADKTYEVREASFRLKAPASWEELKPRAPRVGLILRSAPPKRGEPLPVLLDVAVTPAAKQTPPDEHLAEVVFGLRTRAEEKVKGTGGKVGENQDVKLAGAPAVQFSYSDKAGGRDAKAFRTVAVRGGHIYIIALTADASQDEAAGAAMKKILDSWQWTDDAAAGGK